MSGPRDPHPPDPGTRFDPRDAGERLHRAAELGGRACGPWRRTCPDPVHGAAVDPVLAGLLAELVDH